jgi:lysophospholipase L1-like esterase
MNRRKAIKGSLAVLSLALLVKSDFVYALDPQFSGGSLDPVVINAGIGGNNTTDLLNRVDQDCLAKQPELTVLMVGTNDMNSVKYLPIAQYENNLSTLVKKIKSSGSKVLLMTILPMYADHLLTRHPASFYEPEGVQGRRKQVNDVIQKIADQQRTEF